MLLLVCRGCSRSYVYRSGRTSCTGSVGLCPCDNTIHLDDRCFCLLFYGAELDLITLCLVSLVCRTSGVDGQLAAPVGRIACGLFLWCQSGVLSLGRCRLWCTSFALRQFQDGQRRCCSSSTPSSRCSTTFRLLADNSGLASFAVWLLGGGAGRVFALTLCLRCRSCLVMRVIPPKAIRSFL